ncbi:MAG TPA: iron chelate uptake ABC transporter family permease subunit [Micromonospora sp.]
MRLALALGGVVGLGLVSLVVGVGDLSVADLWAGGPDSLSAQLLLISRIPRTLALILAGMAMGVAGLIMQMLSRNRFVEPSTAGTVEFAGLGLLVVTMTAPALPVIGKMLVAAAFALVGTAIFLRIVRSIPLRSALVVPLIGLMLGGVVEAMSTFLAYRYDLQQTLAAWMTGDFSGVLRGRYELLWIAAVLTVIAYVAADRFTVAGLGEEFTTNLGLNYRRVMTLGLAIVAVVSAVVVVTVGAIPFLGLVVPNIASLLVGDNLRRSIPWVAVLGAGFVLACDIVGRIVRYPYEIPIGTVVGVVGSAIFLYFLLRRARATS